LAQNTSNAPPSRISIEVEPELAKMVAVIQDFLEKSRRNQTGGFGEILIQIENGQLKRFKTTDDYMVKRLA
jgi:hypothetical protein